jgi:ABC-type Co2+ transport system permease subunit
MGHGGLTTIGLNTLVLAATGTLGRLAFMALRRGCSAPWAMAWATGSAQLAAGGLWLAVVALGLTPAAGAHDHEGGHTGLLAALALPLWLLGAAIEAGVAFGIARFIARVHPALLPAREGAA